MAKPTQLSIFDDANVLHNLIENLQTLEKKELESPGSLNKEEKQFLSGVAAMADFKSSPVQPEKLADKKVSPFSKMMMSAAQTFSKAKVAFNQWRQESAEAENVTSSQENKQAKSNEANSSNPSVFKQFQERFSGVTAKVNGKVDGVADQLSFSTSELQKALERKRTGFNNRFLEIYDDVSIMRMKAQTSVEKKIEETKESLNTAKGSIASFVEKFEEPWITISFKGKDSIPELSDISYNVGLYAGKASSHISSALDSFLKKTNSSKDKEVEIPASENSEIKESAVEAVNDVSPVVEVVKESTGVKSEVSIPSVTEPIVVDNEKSIIGSKVVTPGVTQEKEIKVDELKQTQTNENEPKLSFMQKLRNFFAEDPALKAENENKNKGQKIDLTVSEKTPEHFFLDEKTGSLPTVPSIFKATEKRLSENVGVDVHENGGYILRGLDFSNINALDTETKVLMGEKLRKEIAPAFVKEVKAASDYLFTLNKNSKNDPLLSAFSLLAVNFEDENLAKNFLIQAKNDPEKAKELKSMNVPGVDLLLKDVNESVFKIEKNNYLMQAATLDLATVLKAGETIRRSFNMLEKTNPEIINTLKEMDATQLVPSGGKDPVTVSSMSFKMHRKNFSYVLKVPGNEEVKLRDMYLKTQAEIDKKLEQQAKDLKRQESASASSATLKVNSSDIVSEGNASMGMNNGVRNIVANEGEKRKPVILPKKIPRTLVDEPTPPTAGIAEDLMLQTAKEAVNIVEASNSWSTYRTGMRTNGWGYLGGVSGVPRPTNYNVIHPATGATNFGNFSGGEPTKEDVIPAPMPVKAADDLNISKPDINNLDSKGVTEVQYKGPVFKK